MPAGPFFEETWISFLTMYNDQLPIVHVYEYVQLGLFQERLLC